MEDFIKLAEQLVATSTDIIRHHFHTNLAVERKSDGTEVTIADKAAEMAMRELIGSTFPEHGILGEEYDDTQPDAKYQWIIDPIDGTQNFVSGSFLFGTLIGLLHQGKPVLGVISHPLTNSVLVGFNQKTYLNGKIVTTRACSQLEDATLLSTSHWGVGRYHNLRAYERLTQRVRLYRTWGDCHGYFLVATGYADIMIDSKIKPWDVLPLIPIIEGAGGKITDWSGNDILLSRGAKGAIATNGVIHGEIIQALK